MSWNLIRQMARLKRIVAGVLVLMLPVEAVLGQSASARPAAAVVAAPTLASQVLEWREVAQSYPAEAVVEAVRQATLAAQTAGRIVEMRVDAGRRVKAGEVLARIDARESAEALVAARARLEIAKATLVRTQDLYGQKFVSQAALDKALADYKSAAAQAAQAGASSSHATIVAPFAGIVARRLAEPGEMATPGRPLLTLFEPRELRVVASVPQYKLAELRSGMSGRIEIPSRQLWLDARHIEVLPTVDGQSHTVQVRLYLPENAEGIGGSEGNGGNGGNGGIVPGTFARAHFITGLARKLQVPAGAVLRRGELTGVYVLDEQGRPRLRQVRLGEPLVGGGIEVMAGLNPGERIALDPVKAGFVLRQSR